MKKLILPLLTALIIFSACSQPNEDENQFNYPSRKDPQAEQKVEVHNKIAKGIHEIGTKARKLKEDFALYQTNEANEKPDTQNLISQYNEIFKQSEEVRKIVTQEITEKTDISSAFEIEYLPSLDKLLNDFNTLKDQPENKENYDTTIKDFEQYYTQHNKLVEILNRNIYY